VLTVAGSFFFGDVPLALMVGAVMATILLLIELSSSTELSMQEGVSMASRRVWPIDQQARLQRARASRLEAGDTLFKGGTLGSSIDIIGSGRIEIRIDTDQTASGWRRMAVLGPGCIFSEVAMLTGGQRSADTVCVEPAQLFELREESLHALSTQFPAVHSRILANLNRHLATRLIAATDIARSL